MWPFGFSPLHHPSKGGMLTWKLPTGGEARALGRETGSPFEWQLVDTTPTVLFEAASDRALRASRGPRRDSSTHEATSETSEKSYSVTPPASAAAHESSQQHRQQHGSSQLGAGGGGDFGSGITNLRPGLSDIAVGIDVYFKYCHRQPIWCFEREEIGDYAILPEELACSILALTSHFSKSRDQQRLYGDNAKTLIMLLIANGTVELTTIESLCLLSYSSFIGK
jgi:hypothetical protein